MDVVTKWTINQEAALFSVSALVCTGMKLVRGCRGFLVKLNQDIVLLAAVLKSLHYKILKSAVCNWDIQGHLLVLLTQSVTHRQYDQGYFKLS